ncbi:hypothetical protein ACHAXR_001464 [Thalassiosira sp. AJA248-18]
MGFWSRGSDDKSSQESKDFTSDDLSGFSSSDTNYASSSLGSSGGDDAMMASATGLGDMQQFSLALRQQMMVQTVINTLSDKAFEKCITGKPGDSLSGKEAACVNATVCKWLDTNEFMNGRMARKMGGGGQM